MSEVFDIKNNKLFKLPDHELERVCLHIVGGGLTDIQTAQAMLYAHKLRKNGKITAKGYQIKITEQSYKLLKQSCRWGK